MIYGYCRVSTAKQNIERQIDNIKREYPEAIITKEAYTGTKIIRPEFTKLLKKLEAGDTLVFDEVSRMSRDAEEGAELYFALLDKGINLVFLKEHYIDTETYTTALTDRIKLTGDDTDEIFKGINNYFRKLATRQIQQAFASAQKEIDYLHQRTSEGVRNAIKNGKKPGRVAKGETYITKKETEAREQIKKHCKTFNGTLTDKECIKLTGIARNSYYKYKRNILEEMQREEEAI